MFWGIEKKRMGMRMGIAWLFALFMGGIAFTPSTNAQSFSQLPQPTLDLIYELFGEQTPLAREWVQRFERQPDRTLQALALGQLTHAQRSILQQSEFAANYYRTALEIIASVPPSPSGDTAECGPLLESDESTASENLGFQQWKCAVLAHARGTQHINLSSGAHPSCPL